MVIDLLFILWYTGSASAQIIMYNCKPQIIEYSTINQYQLNYVSYQVFKLSQSVMCGGRLFQSLIEAG